MAIEIRRIVDLSRSQAQAIAELTAQLGSHVRIPSPTDLQAVVANDRTALFAACDGETPCGMLTLVWYDQPSGRKAWIEDVVVDASCRNRGIGRALVKTAVAYAGSIGATRVALTSNPTRTAAHALYLTSGFEKAETTVFVLKP